MFDESKNINNLKLNNILITNPICEIIDNVDIRETEKENIQENYSIVKNDTIGQV